MGMRPSTESSQAYTSVRLYATQPHIYIWIKIKRNGTQPCMCDQRADMMGLSYTYLNIHEYVSNLMRKKAYMYSRKWRRLAWIIRCSIDIINTWSKDKKQTWFNWYQWSWDRNHTARMIRYQRTDNTWSRNIYAYVRLSFN